MTAKNLYHIMNQMLWRCEANSDERVLGIQIGSFARAGGAQPAPVGEMVPPFFRDIKEVKLMARKATTKKAQRWLGASLCFLVVAMVSMFLEAILE